MGYRTGILFDVSCRPVSLDLDGIKGEAGIGSLMFSYVGLGLFFIILCEETWFAAFGAPAGPAVPVTCFGGIRVEPGWG